MKTKYLFRKLVFCLVIFALTYLVCAAIVMGKEGISYDSALTCLYLCLGTLGATLFVCLVIVPVIGNIARWAGFE